MTDTKRIVGQRISDRRKKRGLKQSDLALLVDTDRSTISTYEIGRGMPSAAILNKLADALSTSVDYLLGKTENPDPMHPEAEFVKSLNLSDEEILRKFILEIDGQKLNEDEYRDVLAYIRIKRHMKDR